MLSRIVSIQPDTQSVYTPLLAGVSIGDFYGTPLLLGYELGGTACGALAADCFDHSITLRWLCVDQSVQRRGIAGELLDELCTQADKEGVQELDAVVTGDASTPIRSLLLDRGFVQMDGSPVFHFPLSAVLDGPLSAILDRQDKHVVPLRSVPAYLLRSFNNRIAAPDAFIHPPIDPDTLLEESVAWVEKDKITACLLLSACGNGVEVRWIYSFNQNAAAIQWMLAGAANALGLHFPPQTPIYATALVPSVEPIVSRLAGNALSTDASVVRFCRKPEQDNA